MRGTVRRAARGAGQWTALGLLLCVATPLCAGGPPLDVLLNRAAHHAEQFVNSLPDVKCTERVTQAKLNPKGGITHKEESTFDLLLMPQAHDGEIVVQESRLALAEARHSENLSLLVTNGFSTMLLVFHPYFRGSFEFEMQGEEVVDGQATVKVHFRHIAGTRSPTGLLLRGREYPLELEGTAWVQPESGAVVKLATTLVAPMDDVGLRVFRSEVLYHPIAFSAAPRPYWLPVGATIQVETSRQAWRNVHTFTDYKLFSVSSTSSIPSQP